MLTSIWLLYGYLFRLQGSGTRTFNNSVLKLQHMNRMRTDILDVGETTLDVRETTEKWHMIC